MNTKYITSIFVNNTQYFVISKSYFDMQIQNAHESGMLTAYKNMLKSINQQSGL